jgi:hypothetical protein
MMMSKKTIITLLTTITASLSCMTSKLPINVTFIEQYCLILVVISTLVLVYMWWEKLRPNSVQEITCCPVSSFLASKKFLAIVTISFIAIVSFS